MKKNIIILLSACVLLAIVLPTAVFAQNYAKTISNNDVSAKTADITGENIYGNNQEVMAYYFDGGYCRYLKMYDDEGKGGKGGFKAGESSRRLWLDFEGSRYICCFRFPQEINTEEILSEYKNQFENSNLSDRAEVERYLDELLQNGILIYYVCANDDIVNTVDDLHPYSFSEIVE